MDNKLLKEEVNTLNHSVQFMAIELSKNVSKKLTVIETNDLEDPAK